MLGVSEEHFWDSCPTDMQPYVKMDEMQQKRLDYQMWQMGIYINNAVYVAVAKALAGRKAHVDYLQQPLSEVVKETESDPKKDFVKFQAWAVVYNEKNFSKQS